MRTSAGSAIILLIFSLLGCYAKVTHKVRCDSSSMLVDVYIDEDVKDVYLDHLKGYPKCQPKQSDHRVMFNLPLDDTFYFCGTTKVLNKLTGGVMFYHRIVVEHKDPNTVKEVVTVKCNPTQDKDLYYLPKGNRTRRDILPAGFEEPEHIDITSHLVEKAITPELSMQVLKADGPVQSELTVEPGTDLTMEIRLDKGRSVYGINNNHMVVSDTKNQEEGLIYNGCSLDTYLFKNFQSRDGKVLSANFKAFKFPQSRYVFFKSIVNVCLDKCQPVECSNGEMGYGRKKRVVPNDGADPNILFEVITSTSIKVQYANEIPLKKGSLSGYHHEAPEFGEAIVEPIHGQRSLQYTVFEGDSGSTAIIPSFVVLVTSLIATLRFL